MDFLTDEDMDSIEDGYDDGADDLLAPIPLALPPPPQGPVFYPMSLASATLPTNGTNGEGTGLSKRLLGAPIWAWGLILAGAGGAGYLYYRSRGQVKANSSGESDSGSEGLYHASSELTANGAWSPSRSRFAELLQRYYQRKGMSAHVTVWHDADDAKEKAKLPVVSPLVNVQVHGGAVKADTALVRFARREGLNPVQHQDGSIGFYPHTTKRGKEWEEYIDALRDDGQKV